VFIDLAENEVLKNFNIFCGAMPGVDMKKVHDLKKHVPAFFGLLKTHGIKIVPFTADDPSHIKGIKETLGNLLAL